MREKRIGIYCIENVVNNKKYIGQSIDIDSRWAGHRRELNKQEHNNSYLQRAWNKYGADNFKFYVVKICAIEELDDFECHYIAFYNTTDRTYGYNLESGGNKNKHISDETRAKIGEFNKGKKHSDETREKLRQARIGENNPMFGQVAWNKGLSWNDDVKQKMSDSWDYDKHVTDEMRKNVSNSMKTLWTDDRKEYYSQKMSGENSPFRIVVYCPELDETFLSMTDAHDKYGVLVSSISNCISGKLKSAGKHPITGEKLHWVKLEK